MLVNLKEILKIAEDKTFFHDMEVVAIEAMKKNVIGTIKVFNKEI